MFGNKFVTVQPYQEPSPSYACINLETVPGMAELLHKLKKNLNPLLIDKLQLDKIN